jgi:uncharacterized protein (DUF433 family)
MTNDSKPQDPKELPAYTVAEAAHYLDLAEATLRSWVVGRGYPVSGRKKFSPPLIDIPEKKPPRLSFWNLVEAHVLSAIRRKHRITLPAVRKALDYLKERHPSQHPLIEQHFLTDGVDLFIESYSDLINASREGQVEMKKMIECYLGRVERDPGGIPIKLYPFTRTYNAGDSRPIVIDPLISFGRPVLVGTGIPTAMIAQRYKAGESIKDLATDYAREEEEIQEAIRCELELQAA